MKQIKNILFFNVFLCISIACSNTFDKNETKNISDDKQKSSLPFNLKISLDIIALELEHYKDQFKADWNTNVHAQVIIEEAEILVQTAPIEFQNELKTSIINIFAKNDLDIEFTTQNRIITNIEPIKLIFLKEDTKIKRLKSLPKKHKKKQQEAKQIVAPKKIHGARRTMKRLKKEAEERRQREYEAIKTRIEAKKEAVLKAKKETLLQKEARIRENIIREHAKDRAEILHKISMDLYPIPTEEHL